MDDAVSQSDAPPALNVGDRVELTIDDMAFGGEGVGRIDGFVIFVPFVITGEIVLVEITEKSNCAVGRGVSTRITRIARCTPPKVG